MKEMLSSWIQAVSENQAVRYIGENRFLCGLIAGILLLILLRLLWRICCCRRGCSFIEIKSKAGDITISSNAVFSLVKRAAEPIKCLRLKKLVICKRKENYDFLLRAVLDSGEDAVPQIMEKLTNNIRQQMSAVFALDNIDQIKLKITSCRLAVLDDFADDSGDDGPNELVDALESSASENKSITLNKVKSE